MDISILFLDREHLNTEARPPLWLLLQFVASELSAMDRSFGTTWCKFTALGKSSKIRINGNDPHTGAGLGSFKRGIWNITQSQSSKPDSNSAAICASLILVLYLQHKRDSKQKQSFTVSSLPQPIIRLKGSQQGLHVSNSAVLWVQSKGQANEIEAQSVPAMEETLPCSGTSPVLCLT